MWHILIIVADPDPFLRVYKIRIRVYKLQLTGRENLTNNIYGWVLLIILTSSVADPHPHDFGLLDPHLESAFQMRIPDADADSD